MDIYQPRRAVIKGGLAAAIAGLLSSCGMGQIPAFAADDEIREFPLQILWDFWPKVRAFTGPNWTGKGPRVSNKDTIEFSLAYFRSFGVDTLPATFVRDHVRVVVKGFDNTVSTIVDPKEYRPLSLVIDIDAPGLREANMKHFLTAEWTTA